MACGEERPDGRINPNANMERSHVTAERINTDTRQRELIPRRLFFSGVAAVSSVLMDGLKLLLLRSRGRV